MLRDKLLIVTAVYAASSTNILNPTSSVKALGSTRPLASSDPS